MHNHDQKIRPGRDSSPWYLWVSSHNPIECAMGADQHKLCALSFNHFENLKMSEHCTFKMHLSVNVSINFIKIHRWCQSIVKTVHSHLRIYCHFSYWPGRAQWLVCRFYHDTTCLMFLGWPLCLFYLSILGVHVPILCIFCRKKSSITIDS